VLEQGGGQPRPEAPRPLNGPQPTAGGLLAREGQQALVAGCIGRDRELDDKPASGGGECGGRGLRVGIDAQDEVNLLGQWWHELAPGTEMAGPGTHATAAQQDCDGSHSDRVDRLLIKPAPARSGGAGGGEQTHPSTGHPSFRTGVSTRYGSCSPLPAPTFSQYAYWKDYRGVTHKQYVGKRLPEVAQTS